MSTSISQGANDQQSQSLSRAKPRPITSCAACRSRKVKCNRLSPCDTCIARGITHECVYTTTEEDRQAIAQADLISELRATRNRLRGQLAHQSQPYQYQYQYQSQSQDERGQQQQGRYLPSQKASEEECDEEGGDGQEAEREDLEAVYSTLRQGSWDAVQQLIRRIRNGESLRGMTGEDGMEGGRLMSSSSLG